AAAGAFAAAAFGAAFAAAAFAGAALGAAAFGSTAALAAAAGAFFGVAAFAIVNTLFNGPVMSAEVAALERLGARNDLDQFLGDLRLALTVVGDRQFVDH